MTNSVRSKINTEPNWEDDDEDFDEICENATETALDLRQKNGSLLMSLLRQMVTTGRISDLLPIWVFEKRSLLEVYADFFAHPNAFVAAADLKTPEERLLAVVRFYLKSLCAMKRHENAKKPYNPILGETFRCRWKIENSPPTNTTTKGGPFLGSDCNEITYFAEQVSHHPPISAFYAEHPAKNISYTGTISTKVAIMKYIPPSIGAYNIGEGVLKLHSFNEEYVMTFPDAYGRNVLAVPYVEFGGTIKIKCTKTGYKAKIEFKHHESDGTRNKIEGTIYNSGKKILQLNGKWTDKVNAIRVDNAKGASAREFLFSDSNMAITKKECDPISKQGDRESRRLWRHVTAALYRANFERAKKAKEWISQRQRAEAARRAQAKIDWAPIYFSKKTKSDTVWTYKNEIGKRKNV